MNDLHFLNRLEAIIADRLARPSDSSYTARLAAQGKLKVAQKLGEEAVEVALAAIAEDDNRLTAEAADLVYHLLLQLSLRGLRLADVIAELERRHAAKAPDGA